VAWLVGSHENWLPMKVRERSMDGFPSSLPALDVHIAALGRELISSKYNWC
jgi:hypothetical protein